MNQRFNEIFEIMSFYDDFRWANNDNYNLINFFKTDLGEDTKILTHWLCYVTDRQMPFKIIWDVGGFVISELIYQIKESKTLDLLNPKNDISFIRKENTGNKYFLINQSDANELIRNNYKKYILNNKVKFKSRFFPSDYFAILYTFVFLADYDFNFSKFLKEIYLRNKHKEDFIKRILFSLYLITYYNGKQPSSNEIGNFVTNYRKSKERKEQIKNILNTNDIFEQKFKVFRKHKIYEQKRAWCSLRDFLKSPESKYYFRNSLRKEGLVDEDFDKLFSLHSLSQLELPGDVWNNNSKFRTCILKNTEYEDSKKQLNRIIREYYDKNSSYLQAYPEQFDITFDFVPRMCEQDNCDICPIDKISDDINNFYKVCVKDENMFCPVALVGCNYKNNCIGKIACKIA